MSSSESIPIPQIKPTAQLHSDLTHLSSLLHLLHHRNHNQHRRSVWYRHFSTFRTHLDTLIWHISVLRVEPSTFAAKHRKKTTDRLVHEDIGAELAFWRDVMIAKWERAFGQVLADGRFAVLGVVLVAALSQVVRAVGLLGVFEEMGEMEVRRALEKFADEEWGVQEGKRIGEKGVKVEREGDVDVGGGDDFGEVITRRDDLGDGDEGGSDDDGVFLDAKAIEQTVRKGESSACLAPEQDVLKRSREALEKEISATPAVSLAKSVSPSPVPVKAKKSKSTDADGTRKTEKRSVKEKPSSSSKPLKKKKKKNAIDDLFSGL